MEPKNDTVWEGNHADKVRQDRLWFLESMDQINRTIQNTEDFEQMSHVLDVVLSVFGCDRAWILYPCGPENRTCRTVAQVARPEFSDSVFLERDVPMDAELAHVHRVIRASEGAVRFGQGTDMPVPGKTAERFGVQSQMCLAVHPKIDQPYQFGLDQCTRPRDWTHQEQRLFEAIGQRLATLLTSLLLSRDLQESKARLEEAQRVAHVGYWVWDLDANRVIWSDETYRIFGLKPQEGPIDLTKVREMIHPDDQEEVFRTADEAIRSGARADS